MNRDSVKQCLVRDKEFLRELYQNNSSYKTKTILNSASDLKLDTLIKFLHFLSNGEIPIKKANFDALKTHKRLQFIKKVNFIDKILFKYLKYLYLIAEAYLCRIAKG